MLKLKFFHLPTDVVAIHRITSHRKVLKCSTAFSYKMTLSHQFLEGSTAEARDTSRWNLVLGKVQSPTRSFSPAWVIHCGCTIPRAEESWSSLVLVPASGYASSDSSSESRVYFSVGSGTDTHTHIHTHTHTHTHTRLALDAPCIMLYVFIASVLCFHALQRDTGV